MSEYINNEKTIQERITKKIEDILHTSIKDETLFKSKSLKAEYGYSYKSYIIKDEFVEAIKRLNPSILNNPDILIDYDNRIQAIWEDFSSKYNITPQEGLHHLFMTMTHSISFKCKDGIHPFRYFILDQSITTTQCSNNKITIIREKALYMDGDGYQYPDFAIYCNGLPFFIIEVKNPQTTNPLLAALEDYRGKKTYHRFMLFIGTDGQEISVLASPNTLNIATWRNYGKHRDEQEDINGFFDFFNEIINNQLNLMLFCKFGIFSIPINKNSPDKTILSTARVQQYFLIKAFFYKVKEFYNKGNEPFRCLVKHPARSGKTISARSCIEMVLSLFHNKFDKIFIQAPDTKIAEQFWKDCYRFNFSNNMPVYRIECRKRNHYNRNFSYEEAITSASKGIYIMNMQNIDSEELDVRNDSHKVLFIIDEVHTHQNANMSTYRDLQFPNASYLVFTATPRIKKHCDISSESYNSSNEEYFDELTNEDALGLNIVVPILYQKVGYDIYTDKEKINSFGQAYTDLIYSEFETNNLCKNYENEKSYNEFAHPIENKATGLKEANKEISKSPNAMFTYLSRQNIEKRIEFIINFKKKMDKETYGNKFKTKAFWVVDSKKDALEIINYFNLYIGSHTYKGQRFAVDFSAEEQHISQILSNFSDVEHSHIIHHFSSGDENSIDILILVSKYLKGYDNKDLCYVFCDTAVNEPTKVYQLFTRSGTIRKNKPFGYFVDMCINDNNYKTLKQAIGYYEYHNKIAPLLLSEETILDIQIKIREAIERIADCCYLNMTDMRIALRENISLFVGLPFDRKVILYETVKDLINLIKTVPGRCIGDSNHLDIHMISRAFKYLISNEPDLNKKTICFTQEKHMEMMRNLMNVLGIHDINELLDVSLNNEVYDRYIELSKDDSFYDIRDFFSHQDNGQISNRRNNFSDVLNQKALDIKKSNWSDNEIDHYSKESKEKSVIQSIIESYMNEDYPIPDYITHKEEWNSIIKCLEPLVKEAEERNQITFGRPIQTRFYKQFKNKLIDKLELSKEMRHIFSDDNSENYYDILNKIIIYILEN